MISNELILEINDISFGYGKGKNVFNNIFMDVYKNEIVGIMGPSGCGKTTFLRLISGFASTSAGTIKIAGKEISEWPREHRPSSMVFQNYALFPYMSVRDNIAFGLQVRKVPMAEQDKKVDELLEMLELKHVRNSDVKNLSGGQKQRVAIGRSLAVEPLVMLMDEPLSAVDERLRDDLRTLIRTVLKQKKISAILVSHAFQDTVSMCDRISFWDGHVLTTPRTVEEWINDPQKEYIAEMVGYKNIVPYEWLKGLSANLPEIKTSDVVIPEESIQILAAGTQPSASTIQAKAVVETQRFRGTKKYTALHIAGRTLEAPTQGHLEEGSVVTIAIDTSNLIAVAR